MIDVWCGFPALNPARNPTYLGSFLLMLEERTRLYINFTATSGYRFLVLVNLCFITCGFEKWQSSETPHVHKAS